jgi:lipopolysaccharide transport system ATP-binding protein
MPSAIAITCQGVSKRFALVDGGSAWRLAFGAGRGVPVYEALRDVGFAVPKVSLSACSAETAPASRRCCA